MRATLATLALVFVLLTTVAMLALHNFGGELGIGLHVIPASAIMNTTEVLGLYLPHNGSIIRNAHGPPFLSPLGVLLVYAVPAALFAAIAIRGRRTRR